MNTQLILIGMTISGFLLHFFTSWGAHWRNASTEDHLPFKYVALDLPGWMASVVGTIIAFFAMPELDSLARTFFAMPPGFNLGETPVGAATMGYLGSSQAPKIMGMITAKMGIR